MSDPGGPKPEGTAPDRVYRVNTTAPCLCPTDLPQDRRGSPKSQLSLPPTHWVSAEPALHRLQRLRAAAIAELVRRAFRLLAGAVHSCPHFVRKIPKRKPTNRSHFRYFYVFLLWMTNYGLPQQLLSTNASVRCWVSSARNWVLHRAADMFRCAPPFARVIFCRRLNTDPAQ